MKCPRCQQENPPQAKVCLKCGTPFVPIEEDPGPGALYAGIHSAPSEVVEQQATAAFSITLTSATDVQPALGAIARTAARLCEAGDALIYVVDGDQHRFIAKHGRVEQPQRLGDSHPIRRDTPLGLAVLDRRPVHVRDIRADLHGRFSGLQDVRILVSRVRTVLAMPLLREGVALGGIVIRRTRVQPFTAKQVALLKTFADQAAIVIENLRLFTELQEKNKALTQAHAQVTEALGQQTATSEILRVISSSPTDVQPVFDAIAESARRLCDADFCNVARYEDGLIYLSAHAHSTPELVDAMRRMFPMPPTRATTFGRTITEGGVVYIRDIREDPEYSPTLAEAHRSRCGVGVPMLRDAQPIGAIVIGGREPQKFSDAQIELLQTFADQAVIAIENVRLFTELQEKNRALTVAHAQVSEALEQQTATAEILRVISTSPTDLQPVLDALARSAVRFCGAYDATLFQVDGETYRVVAHHGPIPFPLGARFPLVRGYVTGRSILDRQPVHVTDLPAEISDFPEGSALASEFGQRTTLAVPLLREGEAIGTIQLRRTEPKPFTDKEIALLKTFADQAAIAIENVRLFTELAARTAELTRSVDELTALGDVGRALSSTLNLEAVLQTIVTRATQLTEMAGCVIWEYDKPRDEFRLRVSHYADNTDASILPARGGVTTIPRGQGLTTQVMEERRAVQIPDITIEGAYDSPVRKPLIDAGHRALLGVPLLSEDEVIGVLAVTRKTPGLFESETVRLLSTFATQSALAMQNARLFL